MTRAVQIAELGDQNVFTINSSNNRVGIGSTLPTHKLDVNDGAISVGTGITMDSASGIITATKFVGPMEGTLTGNISGTSGGLSGTPDITVRNVTGVAATFTGDVSVRNLTGVAATFTGALTYEDVTNIDSIGIITARSHVSIADSILHTGDTDTSIRFPAADTFTVETGGSERVRVTSAGLFGVGTNNPQLKFVVSNNNALGFEVDPSQSSGTILGINAFDRNASAFKPLRLNAEDHRFDTSSTERLRIDSSGRTLIGNTQDSAPFSWGLGLQVSGTGTNAGLSIRRDQDSSGGALLMFVKSRGSLNGNTVVQDGDQIGGMYFNAADGTDVNSYAAQIAAEIDGTPGSNDVPGRLKFSTTADGASSPTERLRITSRGGFHFSNGFMNETVKINTSARTGTQAVNLDDGMVHYFSTNSAGTWKPNFTMSAGDDINATIATGDVFSPTMIVAKGATSHYATTIQVDGSDVTPEFSGGAPSDGGGSGTFDVYNYTIIKTGDDTFKAFAAVSTYE